MSDQDHTRPEEALAALPAQVEGVPAEPKELQTVESPDAGPQVAVNGSKHKAHQHPDLLGTQAFFTVVIFSIFVITFIVQAFQIPSSSMENTLLVGDFLLVDKLHFAGQQVPGRLLPYREIHRGDIVVFYYPVDSSQFLVKRVIGLPG